MSQLMNLAPGPYIEEAISANSSQPKSRYAALPHTTTDRPYVVSVPVPDICPLRYKRTIARRAMNYPRTDTGFPYVQQAHGPMAPPEPPAHDQTLGSPSIAEEELHLARTARRHSDAHIGRPVHFEIGPHAGRTIRAQLDVIQNAEQGRKCADPPRTAHNQTHADGSGTREAKKAKKDRRPLDPPPVIRLRMFEVIDEGTSHETERELTPE